MQKIKRLVVSFITVLTFALVPVSVHAQEDVVTVDGDPTDTTTTETVGIPETGIAPKEGGLFTSSAVFLAGSTIGAGVGLGVLALKKRQTNQ